MTTLDLSKPIRPAPVEDNYLTHTRGLMSWLLTLDHKRIGVMYLIAVLTSFLFGGLAALAVRTELIAPGKTIMDKDAYNQMFTLHGAIMVFLVIIPSVPAALGNFVLPIMLGAKDVAFPRLNLLSFWLWVTGAICFLGAITGIPWPVQGADGWEIQFVGRGLDTGWTFYTPYSIREDGAMAGVLPATFGVFILGFSSIFTGMNFIVTIHRLRPPGMTWFKMPLFLWATYATSLINILGTPVIAITALLVAAERMFGFGFFDPSRGGDPVLFQHLFWFYSHPAVYIMVLPAMGVISELVAAFCRKQIFGYTFVAFASLGIAVLGFLVWGHHMFVAGQSIYASLVFSLLSFLVAIPSAVKVFNWTATMYKGSVSWDTPMLYAIGFIGLFTIGGLTGLFLATLGMDVHVTDTYFVVAHFHYIMVGGAIMGYLGGLHYWWPKISGRLYPEWWARVSAVLVFAGFNLTFLPQFVLGYLGMPRRYHYYPEEFQVLNVMSSAGASILAIGYVLPMIYMAWSMRYGRIATANPFGATGLEWRTSSPPPTFNFPEAPVVDEEVYDYAAPRKEAAFV